MVYLKAGSVNLPSPVKIVTGDEIIWSANTGRSTKSGKMIGDVIAQKISLDVEWGVLTAAELKKIADNLKTGFYPITFYYYGQEKTITVYRGTLKSEYLGYFGGIHYYKNVTLSLIQQ